MKLLRFAAWSAIVLPKESPGLSSSKALATGVHHPFSFTFHKRKTSFRSALIRSVVSRLAVGAVNIDNFLKESPIPDPL
jgi:hypothetical protein